MKLLIYEINRAMIQHVKKITILALLLLSQIVVLAKEETYSVRKNGGDVIEGLSFEIRDGRYSELSYDIFFDKSTRLIVKFGIQERSDMPFINGFASLSADLKIYKLNAIGEEIEVTSETTTISYSPTASAPQVDLSLAKLEGGHRYRIEVETLTFTGGYTTVPANVYLEAELRIDRYYAMDTEAPLIGANFIGYDEITNAQCSTPVESVAFTTEGVILCGYAPQEIEIYWSYVKGAEEYELEWTWIDNYAELESENVYFNERDFELNNTRILTAAQSYRIPLIYSEGYLIYRVRAVGRWTDNDLLDVDKPYFGDWSHRRRTVDRRRSRSSSDYGQQLA